MSKNNNINIQESSSVNPESKNNTLEEALSAKKKSAGNTAAVSADSKKKSDKKKKTAKIAAIVLASVAGVFLMIFIWMKAYAPEMLTGFFNNPLKSGKTIMTVNGNEISSEEYLSYLMPVKKVFEDQYGAGVWGNNPDLEKKLIESVEDYVVSQYVLLAWAEEYGITIDGVTEEEFGEQKQNIIAQFGSEAGYKAALKELYTTEEVYDLQIKQDIVITKLSKAIAEADDSYFVVSDDDVREYYESNGLYTIKHILFSIADSSIEDVKKKADTADEVLAEILGGADFDTLAKLYSDDQEQTDYSKGYICAPGAQEPELEKAALSIGTDEVYPEVVVATYGYHIVKRIDPSNELLHAELDDIILDGRVQAKKDEIRNRISVTYCSNYDDITISFIDYLAKQTKN